MGEFEIGDIVTVRYENEDTSDPLGEWEVVGPSTDRIWPIKIVRVDNRKCSDIVNEREIFLVAPRDSSEFECDI